MKLTLVLALALSLFLLAAGSMLAIAFAASPDQGFVAYSATLSNNGSVLKTATINESSAPASQSGFLTLTFNLVSGNSHLSYSKVVNGSALPTVFPYIPASVLTNQTFSYSRGDISLNAHLTNAGQSQITFNGNNYQASNYQVALSATNSSSGKTLSASGNMQLAPSGLLYSLDVQVNSTATLQVQLIGTSLSLASPSSSTSTTMGIAIVGAGVIGSVALAVPSFFKMRKSRRGNDQKTLPDALLSSSATSTQQSVEEEAKSSNNKPSHWVD